MIDDMRKKRNELFWKGVLEYGIKHKHCSFCVHFHMADKDSLSMVDDMGHCELKNKSVPYVGDSFCPDWQLNEDSVHNMERWINLGLSNTERDA